MMKVSPWVWVGLAVVGALAVFVQQSSQASYWRGIADDAESRLETQQLVLDSVGVHADSLTEALAAADSAAIAQRLQAEREVAQGRLVDGRCRIRAWDGYRRTLIPSHTAHPLTFVVEHIHLMGIIHIKHRFR
jgi:hypothetical protein